MTCSIFLLVCSFNLKAEYIYDDSNFNQEKVISELFKEFDIDSNGSLDKYEIETIYNAFYEQIKDKIFHVSTDREDGFYLDFAHAFWFSYYPSEKPTLKQKSLTFAFKACYRRIFCYNTHLKADAPKFYHFRYFMLFIEGP